MLPYHKFVYVVCAIAWMMVIVPMAKAQAHPAQQLVEQTTTKLIDAFASEKSRIDADPAALRDVVGDIILPHFDFVRMSKLALGKHWRKASVAQRKEFATQFRELLVNTYAKSLYKYADAKFTYRPTLADAGDKDVDVVSEVSSVNDAQPVDVVYSLHSKDGSWQVFNVTIEGVSLITNYRSTFSEFVAKHGMDALNSDLERRNRRIASGQDEDEPA